MVERLFFAMAIDYINLARAGDLAGAPRAAYRFLEILPGLLAWATLLFGFVLSWFWPLGVAIFIIAFDLYWLLRVLYLAAHQISSYRRMQNHIKTDWTKKLKKDFAHQWQEIYHLVILPFAGESGEVVRTTLDSLIKSDYPKNKMIVLLAAEDNSSARQISQEVQEDYKNKFFALWPSIHPKGVAGELQGKGANVNWALDAARDKFLPQIGIAKEKIIVSLFDIDTKPQSQYFACLAWHFLKSGRRLRQCYQPIPVYNNNIWSAPAVSRIIATSATFWEMMQQERPEQLVTFSSHSMPLATLLEVGYPRNVVSDDSRIFWRAYFHYKGDYQAVPLYYPVSMDAVLGRSFWRTMINQYKQQRRWSWGVENLPYVFFNLFAGPVRKSISFRKKMFHVATIVEGFWTWATASLLIFGLAWLPLLLGGQDFGATLLSYNLPRFTSVIMTMAMIGMLISAIVSMLILPPPPKKYGIGHRLSMFFQWALLPITLIVFGAFPALESQTRMIINKPLGFWVTEKGSKKS